MNAERLLVVPADHECSKTARTFVGRTLTEWGHDDLVADAQLLVSELVANTLVHTDANQCVVEVIEDLSTIRVEVYDSTPGFEYRYEPDLSVPGGLGLSIVDSVAVSWGIDPRLSGKAVWFELATSMEPAVG